MIRRIGVDFLHGSSVGPGSRSLKSARSTTGSMTMNVTAAGRVIAAICPRGKERVIERARTCELRLSSN